jgi:hypothetical protein
VTSIEGEHVSASMALGQNHDRGIGKSHPEVGIAAHHGRGKHDIRPAELGKLIGTLDHLSEQRKLWSLAMPLAEHVVKLGKHERGKQKRAGELIDDAVDILMEASR